MSEESKNQRAEEVCGRRVPEGETVLPFDFPCELGYECPVCRALLAQKAVVEAAVEQERQRFLADESRAARQDLETQAQHTEDYRSACRATNAAVRAMKEQAR